MHHAPVSSSSSPAAMAIVEHAVADFDTWKATFDALGDLRRRSGVLSARVCRSADGPDRVAVCLTADGFEAFSRLLADPDRRRAMERAGVIGNPVSTFAVPVEDRTVRDRRLPGAFTRHRVADFDAWKRGFDSFAAMRAQAGVVGHAVARVKDDPDEVIVMLQGESSEALSRFIASDERKQAMAALGVQGVPRDTLVEVLALDA